MKLTPKFLTIFALHLLLLISILSAEELSFYIDPDYSACNAGAYNASQVKTNYAEFKYDTETKLLNIEVEFSNASGTIANGFHFAINSESSLICSKYKLAYIYVDGTKIKAGSSPTLSAFIFNRDKSGYDRLPASSCNNGPGSWQTNAPGENLTEPILANSSGHNGNPSWVEFSEVEDTGIGQNLTKKFTIVIDTAEFGAPFFTPNDTVPYLQNPCVITSNEAQLRSYNQSGRLLDFGRVVSNSKKLSLDFVPSVISSSTYSGNQLTNLAISSCSMCRVLNTNVNTAPSCSEISNLPAESNANQPISVTISFTDPDSSDSHQANYSGNIKPSMTFTPAISGDRLIPAGNTKSAMFNWTPTNADVGYYSIPVTFTQQYGHNKISTLPTGCTLNFEVISTAAECNVTDLSAQLELINGSTIKLLNLLKKVNRLHLRSLPLKKRSKQDKLPKLNELQAILQERYNSIPVNFNICTDRTSSCEQDTIFDDYVLYKEKLTQTFCDGKKITSCSFADNVGKRLIINWKNNQINLLKASGQLTSSKQSEIQLKYKDFIQKAANFSAKSYNTVNSLITGGYINHYICQ